MARQQEHLTPSDFQIIPGNIEEICKSILVGKLRDEDNIQEIINQVENMLVRRLDFESVGAELEIQKAEIRTLQAHSEIMMKERLGIRTRDFVRGIVRQTSGVDQQELVLEHGT